MIKNKFILILLFIVQLTTINLSASEVHGIIVADSLLSPRLLQNNIDQMIQHTKEIAANNNLPAKIAIFKDFNVRMENVLHYINTLDVDSDDIIVFYVMSRGQRFEDKSTKWPDICLLYDVYFSGNNGCYDFEQIHETLKSKNSKFLLSIADTSNFIEKKNRPPHQINFEELELKVPQMSIDEFIQYEYLKNPISGPTMLLTLSQYDHSLVFIRSASEIEDDGPNWFEDLFASPRGTIMVATTSPGENCIINNFTSSYLMVCEAMGRSDFYSELTKISGKKPAEKWKTLLAVTAEFIKRTAKDDNQIQTLQYDIDLK